MVTGATGKVGSAVARKLAESGDDVVALVRDAAGARELLPPRIELAVGDVTDPRSLARAAEGIDGAFNCMPFGVLGPGPWAATGIDGFLRDAVRRRLPALPPGGMTLVFTEDVAAGHLAAFERGAVGERYILADGFARPREIAAEAGRRRGPGLGTPDDARRPGSGPARAGEAIARAIRRPPLLAVGQLHFLRWEARADSSRAREELGIDFTPWPAAVHRTVEWMREIGGI